jgi:PAS domain S-box-containing protein
MAKKPEISTKMTNSRRQAEARLGATKRDIAALPVKGVQQLVHELQVHQIELEMQNEELRRSQTELEEARDRYADLYDFSPVGHLTLDLQGKILEANQRVGTLLATDRKKLIGKLLASFVASDDQGTFRQHCRDVIREGTRQTCEVRLKKVTGDSPSLYCESLAVRDETGQVTHWRMALLDISDLKRAEGEVRRSEAFVSSILENLPNMIFVKDARDLTFVRFNKAGEDLLGYPKAELIGKNDYDFFPRDEADFFTAKDREVLASARLLDIPEEPIRTKSGEVRYLHTKKIPIVGKEGTPQYLLGISEDITDLKRVQEALLLAKFSMDRAADAIYWIDPQARILDVNETAGRMLGYSKDELCAMTVHDLNPDVRADMWPGFWAETQRRGTMAFETAHLAKDGRLIPVEVSVNYLFYEGKEYHCAFVRDITERRMSEETLKARDSLTRAILDSLPAQVCVLDGEGIILQTNDAWNEFSQRCGDSVFTVGAVGDKYLERCRSMIGNDSTSQAILKGVESVLTGEQLRFTAEHLVSSQEEAWWFLMHVAPLKDRKGLAISHTDISERVRLARLLEQHVLAVGEKRGELEFLARKLIDAQEEERKRIARELHDDFNQRLAALSVELENMERAPVTQAKLVGQQLAKIRSEVAQLSDDLHDLAYGLHPSLLDHVGLEAALRDHVAEFRKRVGLSATFDARRVPVPLSKDISTNLFRILQESLQNVSKHAQATEVTVRLSGSSKGVGLSVRDNGKGFDPEGGKNGVRGLGLVSMYERARGLGGFFRIHSLAGGGTKVCAWVPYLREDP